MLQLAVHQRTPPRHFDPIQIIKLQQLLSIWVHTSCSSESSFPLTIFPHGNSQLMNKKCPTMTSSYIPADRRAPRKMRSWCKMQTTNLSVPVTISNEVTTTTHGGTQGLQENALTFMVLTIGSSQETGTIKTAQDLSSFAREALMILSQNQKLQHNQVNNQ